MGLLGRGRAAPAPALLAPGRRLARSGRKPPPGDDRGRPRPCGAGRHDPARICPGRAHTRDSCTWWRSSPARSPCSLISRIRRCSSRSRRASATGGQLARSMEAARSRPSPDRLARWPARAGLQRAVRAARRRGLLSRLGASSSARVRAVEPPIEHEDEPGLRAQVATGLRFIGGKHDLPADAHGRCDAELLQLRLPRALHPLRDPVARRRRRDAGAASSGAGPRRGPRGASSPGEWEGRSASAGPSCSAACSSRRRLCSCRWRRARGGSSSSMLFAAEFLSGLGVMILDINVGSIMFALTPDRLRSRATGAFNFVNWGIRPLGALAGGALGAAHRRAPDALGRPASARWRACSGSCPRRCRPCATCPRRPRDRRPLAGRARGGRAGSRAGHLRRRPSRPPGGDRRRRRRPACARPCSPSSRTRGSCSATRCSS